jgi:hypothetical protein
MHLHPAGRAGEVPEHVVEVVAGRPLVHDQFACDGSTTVFSPRLSATCRCPMIVPVA